MGAEVKGKVCDWSKVSQVPPPAAKNTTLVAAAPKLSARSQKPQTTPLLPKEKTKSTVAAETVFTARRS